MHFLFRISLFIFLLALPATSFAATLSVVPASGTYTVGDTITVQIHVSSMDQSINAVSGTLSFSPSVFSIKSVSRGSSILNFWPTDPSISQSANTVNFEGVTTAGFQGSGGNVLTIVLRAAHTGVGAISFQAGQVLANDGNGTDITAGLTGSSLNVNAAAAPTVAAVPAAPAPSPAPSVQPPAAPKAPTVSVQATTSPLQAPIITSVSNTVVIGGQANVHGVSIYPGATVHLLLQKADGTSMNAAAVVEQNGVFSISLPYTSEIGPYTGAVVVEQSNQQSPPSQPFIIQFVNTPSTNLIDIFGQPGILIALAMLAAFLLGMYSVRFVLGGLRRNKSAHGVLREVDVEVHKAFLVLRGRINKSLDELAKESAHRNLTPAELRFVREMTSTIKDTEKLIEKDIQSAGR